MKPYPKKSLGQYFLTCEWPLDIICDAAGLTSIDTVLEIGPGTGVLTRALARRVKSVVAIEKDEALARALRADLQRDHIQNVHIREGDILAGIPDIPAPYKIVANIPYYLTARFLRLILEQTHARPSHIALMIQKEVAERIVAKPPHENLFALSVQVFGTPSLVAAIPASCFHPKPKVDSAILSLSDISDTFFTSRRLDPVFFFSVLRASFSQKRKTLINSLGSVKEKSVIAQALIHLGLPKNIRPEALNPEQWAEIIRACVP